MSKKINNIAFRKGFEKLNNKILLEKDYLKTRNISLRIIKNLVSHYQIVKNNDENLNGTLHIFDPSNTTFVKHFMARTLSQNDDGQPAYVLDGLFAGYFNTTSALTRFQFKFASGNIDSGTIKLYGVS